MAGERQLARGHPDAVAVVGAVGSVAVWTNVVSDSLRLAREGEHRRVVERVGVVDDGEPVAGQRRAT